jgi:predicted RNA binding protein YcfA (HicA-like mRNA interferase family)
MRPREVIKALKGAGFIIVRQKGSHIQFHHPSRPGVVTVPNYHREIPPKVLKSIAAQAGFTIAEFLELLAR